MFEVFNYSALKEKKYGVDHRDNNKGTVGNVFNKTWPFSSKWSFKSISMYNDQFFPTENNM